MGEKFKNSNFYKKLKNIKLDKTFYVTAATIILAISVVVTIAVLANRAKKLDADGELPSGSDVSNNNEQNNGNSQNGGNDQNGTNNGSQNNQNGSQNGTQNGGSGNATKPAPTFSTLPVESGSLLKGHDATLQVYSSTTGDYRVHLGLDILTTDGAPVLAAEDGVVAKIWEDPMLGWCVEVSHADEYVTFYKNLAKDMAEGISVGVNVTKGQELGYVGNSAMIEVAEEPHLHFEMTRKGISVDPLEHMTKDVTDRLRGEAGYEDEK